MSVLDQMWKSNLLIMTMITQSMYSQLPYLVAKDPVVFKEGVEIRKHFSVSFLSIAFETTTIIHSEKLSALHLNQMYLTTGIN